LVGCFIDLLIYLLINLFFGLSFPIKAPEKVIDAALWIFCWSGVWGLIYRNHQTNLKKRMHFIKNYKPNLYLDFYFYIISDKY